MTRILFVPELGGLSRHAFVFESDRQQAEFIPIRVIDSPQAAPNKAPEATPVGACGFTRRFQWFHIFSPECLSFFR